MATHAHHQIVVYPSRAKLLRYALLYVVGISGLGLFCYWSVTGAYPQSRNPTYDWVFVLIGSLGIFGRIVVGIFTLVLELLMAVILVCTIYRVLVRKPSMIVNSDGIIDGCSLFAGGIGLIRWDEIATIMLYTYNKRAQYLCVIPHDARTLQRHNNPLMRLFRRSITLTRTKGANLPEWLLPMPVDDLAAEVQRHYDQIMRAHRIAIL